MEVADRASAVPEESEPQPLPAPPAPNWKGGLQPLGLVAIAAAGCAYVALVDPNQSSAYPQCPLRALTGYDCPGCGLTRAVHSLMNGNVVQAIDHNVMIVLLLPLAIFGFVRWTASRLGYQLPRLPRWRSWMTVAVAVAGFGFLIVRNLPGFEYLRATAT